MDEDADADEYVVGLRGGNCAVGDAVRDRLRDRMLCGAEHLHRLLGAFNRHLVEHDRRRLGRQIGGDNREKGCEAVLVVGQRVANAVSAALPRGPMMRSIWATSLPSPTSDLPTIILSIFARLDVRSSETLNSEGTLQFQKLASISFGIWLSPSRQICRNRQRRSMRSSDAFPDGCMLKLVSIFVCQSRVGVEYPERVANQRPELLPLSYPLTARRSYHGLRSSAPSIANFLS